MNCIREWGEVPRLASLYFYRTGGGGWWASFIKALGRRVLSRENRSTAMPFQTWFGKEKLRLRYPYLYRSQITQVPSWVLIHNIYPSLGFSLTLPTITLKPKMRGEGESNAFSWGIQIKSDQLTPPQWAMYRGDPHRWDARFHALTPISTPVLNYIWHLIKTPRHWSQELNHYTCRKGAAL